MYIVKFPSVIETFHRAMDEVLAPFLSTGNPATIMLEPVLFYNCDLFYSSDVLQQQPVPKPFIAMVGSRTGSRHSHKVNDPKVARPFAYELRQQVYKTVYVGIGSSLMFEPPPYQTEEPSNRQASMQDVEIIWSQLLMVLEHQHANFSARGIYNPRLPAVPEQIAHPDYHLVRGELSTEIRFTLTRGN